MNTKVPVHVLRLLLSAFFRGGEAAAALGAGGAEVIEEIRQQMQAGEFERGRGESYDVRIRGWERWDGGWWCRYAGGAAEKAGLP